MCGIPRPWEHGRVTARFDKFPPHCNIPGVNKILKKVLAEVAYGLSRAVVISHGRSFVLPAEKSFPLDAANLRRDANHIARGLNKQFNKK